MWVRRGKCRRENLLIYINAQVKQEYTGCPCTKHTIVPTLPIVTKHVRLCSLTLEGGRVLGFLTIMQTSPRNYLVSVSKLSNES